MNNENNNIGNQIPNNNQNINMQNQIQNNNGFNQTTPQYQQTVNPQTNLNSTQTNNNYNPATSQFINQQPVNSNQMNNSFNQNNMYQQSQMNSVNTMSSNQTQYNPQQPIYQNQSYMNNNVSVDKKTNNRKLFLFLGIGIAIFIAIIILVVVLINVNNKNENINEYEDDTNINENVSDQTNSPISTDIQSYKGFDFKKISGYKYVINDDLLVIGNDQYAFLLTITSGNFYSFKTNYQNNISDTLKNMIVGQTKLQTYSNVEIATYEISMNGNNAVYFILASPNQSYCFEGYVMTKDNTFDYSGINELVKLTSNSEYTGNYSNYSSDFGINVDVKDLIEN